MESPGAKNRPRGGVPRGRRVARSAAELLGQPAREQSEEALTKIGGTVVVLLHNRFAIERLATRVVEVRDGMLRGWG